MDQIKRAFTLIGTISDALHKVIRYVLVTLALSVATFGVSYQLVSFAGLELIDPWSTFGLTFICCAVAGILALLRTRDLMVAYESMGAYLFGAVTVCGILFFVLQYLGN